MKRIFLIFIEILLFSALLHSEIVSVNYGGDNSSVINPSNTIEGFFIAWQNITPCVEDWGCSSWSSCSGDTETRTCTDANSCGTTNDKPDETRGCEIITVAGAGGGGGGGGGIVSYVFPTSKSFRVTPSQIKLSLTPGQVTTKTIIIENTDNKAITIDLIGENIEKFALIGENQFTIQANESKEISLDFIIRENVLPNIYLGKLILTNTQDNSKEEILVIIEVQSIGALLDVSAEILEEYSRVPPNKNILAKISLFNLGTENNRNDIAINYIIKDEKGNTILEERETVSLETQTGWVKRLTIPNNTPYGRYVLYVMATTYDGKVASASDTFDVVSPQVEKAYILTITLIVIIGAIVLYFTIIRRGKTEEIIGKIGRREILGE